MSHAFAMLGLAVFQIGIESGWILLAIGVLLLLCPVAIYFAMRNMGSDRDLSRKDPHTEIPDQTNENKENIRRAG